MMNNPFQTYNRGYTARERRIRSKYGLLFLITGLACIWLSVKSYDDSKELEEAREVSTQLQTKTVKMQNQIDELNELMLDKGITALINERDSLRSELFISSTIIGRHELSLDYIRERNPQAARNYVYFFEHQTE